MGWSDGRMLSRDWVAVCDTDNCQNWALFPGADLRIRVEFALKDQGWFVGPMGQTKCPTHANRRRK